MTEDLERRLRLAAHEMKAEDRFGWAAVCEVAAEALSTSRARVDALEKALEPFAAAAETYDPPEGDDQQLLWGPDFVTIGMLRDARAALSRQEEGNG